MNYLSVLNSIFIFLSLSIALVMSGLAMRPGLGFITALIIIPLVMWLRRDTIKQIGLNFPVSWRTTLVQGLGYGVLIAILSIMLIEPLSEYITKTNHDYSLFIKMRGNKAALIQLLVMVWVFVAFAEEIIFRGFLMAEINRVIGSSLTKKVLAIVITSVIFGLCHAYQNTCGIMTTGLIGFLLSVVFYLTGKNLWVTIFAHGVIDTIGILYIYFEWDLFLK